MSEGMFFLVTVVPVIVLVGGACLLIVARERGCMRTNKYRVIQYGNGRYVAQNRVFLWWENLGHNEGSEAGSYDVADRFDTDAEAWARIDQDIAERERVRRNKRRVVVGKSNQILDTDEAEARRELDRDYPGMAMGEFKP